ncbi:Hypothetical predicted protein, partial [Paramuricea clavata]
VIRISSLFAVVVVLHVVVDMVEPPGVFSSRTGQVSKRAEPWRVVMGERLLPLVHPWKCDACVSKAGDEGRTTWPCVPRLIVLLVINSFFKRSERLGFYNRYCRYTMTHTSYIEPQLTYFKLSNLSDSFTIIPFLPHTKGYTTAIYELCAFLHHQEIFQLQISWRRWCCRKLTPGSAESS